MVTPSHNAAYVRQTELSKSMLLQEGDEEEKEDSGKESELLIAGLVCSQARENKAWPETKIQRISPRSYSRVSGIPGCSIPPNLAVPFEYLTHVPT